MIITSLPEKDLELSGPIVWPKLVADHAVDRFIFRRPEMSYMEAIRRIDERRWKLGMLECNLVLLRGCRVAIEEKKKRTYSGWSIYSPIDRTDRLEDVRSFLRRIRDVLYKRMPDSPLLNVNVRINFHDPDDKHVVLSLQERWL